MKVYGDTFPLLVAVGPQHFDEAAMKEMAAAYEPYFARNERYTVLNVSPRGASNPGAKERKLITDWVNSPRVRDCSKRLRTPW